MRTGVWLVLVWSLSWSGCMGAPGRPELPLVEVGPLRHGLATRVPWIRLGASEHGELAPEQLWLFRGELTDSQIGKLRRGEVAESVSARRVPATAWTTVGGTALVPSVALDPGARYTLAAVELGRLVVFDVSADDWSPVLTRLWPPIGQRGAALALYCSSVALDEPVALEFEPAEVGGLYEPGFVVLADGRECGAVTLGTAAQESPFLVPRSLDGAWSFDPAPLLPAPSEPPLAADCTSAERPFGPGCLSSEDDRALLRAGPEPQLFHLTWAESSALWLAPADGRYVLRGLLPDREQEIRGRALSLSGVGVDCSATIHTGTRRARLVLNEVLANPAGPEPAGEWVEIVNDGAEAISLEGVRLNDASGSVALPAVRLEAGEYGLIVREDFPRPSASDAAPPEAAKLIVVPTLGGNGISNSGEVLTLTAADGGLLSSFPALAAKHAGVSLARVRPDAPDGDPASFTEHGAPGASPAAPNAFD